MKKILVVELPILKYYLFIGTMNLFLLFYDIYKNMLLNFDLYKLI